VRLGIFGGSFDPPHLGHLLVVTDAFEALDLDHLVFVPAAVQPLKAGQGVATPRHRLAMVRLLVGDDPRFSVDPIEIEREGLSYTVETLAAFAERHPEGSGAILSRGHRRARCLQAMAGTGTSASAGDACRHGAGRGERTNPEACGPRRDATGGRVVHRDTGARTLGSYDTGVRLGSRCGLHRRATVVSIED